jgi:hypothetical protein
MAALQLRDTSTAVFVTCVVVLVLEVPAAGAAALVPVEEVSVWVAMRVLVLVVSRGALLLEIAVAAVFVASCEYKRSIWYTTRVQHRCVSV